MNIKDSTKKDYLKERTGIQMAVSSKMMEALRKWKKAYINESEWVSEKVPSLDLPSSIASEISRLVTVESEVNLSGSAKADYISSCLEQYTSNKKNIVETACSIGGMYFKPFYDGDEVLIDFVYQDEAIPFRFDGKGNVTGVIFPTFLFKNNKRYTKLEIHDFQKDKYIIENRAFVSKEKDITDLFVGDPGQEISLTDVEEWQDIEPKIQVNGTEHPFYSYFRVPLANNIDRKSPLGVSVYARALKDIKKADIQMSRFDWEFESKETAIELDEDYLQRDVYGQTFLPKGKERMFRTYQSQGSFDKEKLFEHFSPEIRDQSFINGLNKYFQQIEFKCGLAYGTLSDPQQVDKTAEEIKTSKQRSYQLISDIQGSLENALRGLINSIDDLCIANGLFDGGEINVAFTWDDSIIIDAAKEKQQDIQDINTGVLNKYEYRMKWYGEDEETAKAKIAEMNSSRPGITSAFMRDDVGDE